jgi:hypothetical protein
MHIRSPALALFASILASAPIRAIVPPPPPPQAPAYVPNRMRGRALDKTASRCAAKKLARRRAASKRARIGRRVNRSRA